MHDLSSLLHSATTITSLQYKPEHSTNPHLKNQSSLPITSRVNPTHNLSSEPPRITPKLPLWPHIPHFLLCIRSLLMPQAHPGAFVPLSPSLPLEMCCWEPCWCIVETLDLVQSAASPSVWEERAGNFYLWNLERQTDRKFTSYSHSPRQIVYTSQLCWKRWWK